MNQFLPIKELKNNDNLLTIDELPQLILNGEYLIGNTSITMNDRTLKKINEIKNGDIILNNGLVSNKCTKTVNKIVIITTKSSSNRKINETHSITTTLNHHHIVLKNLNFISCYNTVGTWLNPYANKFEIIETKDLKKGMFLLQWEDQSIDAPIDLSKLGNRRAWNTISISYKNKFDQLQFSLHVIDSIKIKNKKTEVFNFTTSTHWFIANGFLIDNYPYIIENDVTPEKIEMELLLMKGYLSEYLSKVNFNKKLKVTLKKKIIIKNFFNKAKKIFTKSIFTT